MKKISLDFLIGVGHAGLNITFGMKAFLYCPTLHLVKIEEKFRDHGRPLRGALRLHLG
jgi:hypothetical protein